MIRKLSIAATALGVLLCYAAVAQDERTEEEPLVLTSMQATWSIANALTEGTPIEVANIPDDGREFAVLRDYLERRKERLAPLFSAATAVVSVTNALPADPLYRYARAANVRIVAIDAALPWTFDTPGVALVEQPRTTVPWGSQEDMVDAGTAPHFWLSVSNAIRMADIVGADLARLFPALGATIMRNLDDFKRELLELRRSYQDRLIVAEADTVFALTGDFIYLTNDMGLFVDGYFIKQDVRWTDADLAALTRRLEERDIPVVIHKWLPSDAIQAAISAAGAELIVLETGDPGRIEGEMLAIDGLQQILLDNLEKITVALSR